MKYRTNATICEFICKMTNYFGFFRLSRVNNLQRFVANFVLSFHFTLANCLIKCFLNAMTTKMDFSSKSNKIFIFSLSLSLNNQNIWYEIFRSGWFSSTKLPKHFWRKQCLGSSKHFYFVYPFNISCEYYNKVCSEMYSQESTSPLKIGTLPKRLCSIFAKWKWKWNV